MRVADVEARDQRRRQALAVADREARELAHEAEAARIEYEGAAARLVLGDGDAAALDEAEAELDRLGAALRRARAAVAGLSV